MKNKLEEKLNGLAEGLKPPQKTTETKLRKQWFAANEALNKSRYELGKALAGYEDLYKGEQKWLSFLKAVGMPRRTADDHIARYKSAAEIPAKYRAEADRQNVDLAKPAVLKCVDIGAWKKAAKASKEVIEKEVAKLKQESRRPSCGTAATASVAAITQQEREDRIRAFAENVYKNVLPSVRAKELPKVMDRITNHLMRYFAIEEEVAS